PIHINLQGTTYLYDTSTSPSSTAFVRFSVQGDSSGGFSAGTSAAVANGLALTVQSVDQNNNPTDTIHNLVTNMPIVFFTQNGTFKDDHIAITSSAPRTPALFSGAALVIAGGVAPGSNLTGFGPNLVGSIVLAGNPGPLTNTAGGSFLIQARDGANASLSAPLPSVT